MKRVMTHGTFDLLHYGHISYLKRAKELGDYLIVAITSDREAKRAGKNPYYDEKIRVQMVGAIRYVDKVIIRDRYIEKEDIIDNEVDIFVASSAEHGIFDYLNDCCRIVYLARTEGISTTKIKSDLKRSE